jgi:ABC-type sulfate transport system substrate-binding protein
VPTLSILAEPPVAVVDANVDSQGHPQAGRGLSQFLYSPKGQAIAQELLSAPQAEARRRRRTSNDLPKSKLVTIDEFGGWAKAQPKYFGDGGTFDQIYKPGAKTC